MNKQSHSEPNLHKGGAVIMISMLAFVGIAAFLLFSGEPSYRGKSLSHWLQEINRARSFQEAMDASDAIQAMNKHALPFLLKEIGYESHLERCSREILQKQRFVKIRQKRPRMEVPAMFAFYQLEEKAAPAIPQLVELAEESDHWAQAAFSLYCIGAKALPALERVCASGNTNAGIAAVTYLMKLSLPRSERPLWLWTGANLLGHFFPNVNDELEAMARLVTNQNTAVRHASLNWFKYQLANTLTYNSNQLRAAIIAVDPKAAIEAGFK